jgi:HEPN domain-containing protein
LIDNNSGSSLQQLQDQIEQNCSSIAPVTLIIIQTSMFKQWIASGHRFARTVCKSAIPVFEANHYSSVPVEDCDLENERTAQEKCYREGILKSREFLAGAELFIIRKQNRMAAFMLHQAVEQALSTLIKIGTGYHCCSHNIERLTRYAGMVSYRIQDVFPRKTEKEKMLFKGLQKAYIGSRYDEDYSIGLVDLTELIDRVREIQEILKESAEPLLKK